jgi:hypothetical protein
MNAPHAAQALAALTGKALRLRASAASQPRGAARKHELADGLERLAPVVAQGPAAVRRLLDASVGQGISLEARKHAGNEIYALALQRQSQGTEHSARARMRAGWERGGDDLGQPIHRATLQEAVALMELAEALHPEPFWTWSRAVLLLRLGHYTAAAEAYASAGGAYARHAPAMVAQCLARAAGTYEPFAEYAGHFEAQIDRCEANGLDPAPLIAVQSRIEQLLAQAAHRPQPAPNATPEQEQPMGNPQLDRAAQAAQEFAELLADGNYEAAQQRHTKHHLRIITRYL